MRVLMMVALIIGFSGVAAANQPSPIEFHHGYMTGNTYRDMSANAQQGYVIGVIDGMFVAPFFGAKLGARSWLGLCIESGMRTDQLKAIIDKYLDEHPDEWDQDMAAVAYSALVPVCRKRGFTPPAPQ